ncbi:hypothetical protein GC089_15920 [Cellulomonas sp. JZ18]|uniref:hypothetical protein n=1 Tax=Cellulomonas sp. JZ18 TaxID=2654191 RepID=UPI0012D44809|nr:hypothetical protein [Cellulomonas sp. JZ18]QGQ20403.1 hypothetical protein GC089_15920 [Cellulomonas sp. JZ18]
MCANKVYNGKPVALYATVYVNGHKMKLCMPQGKLYTLGVRGEWLYEGGSSWPDGCDASSGQIYRVQ